MSANVLMVQGTMSSVGKSLLVAGLCRLYARRGVRVAPFKAQNMSNNAAVCPDGAEIGRAQYTQALACGIEPDATMNPVLLKPEADARSQVVVMGRMWATVPAKEYYRHKPMLWQTITAALNTLRDNNELVIIEGAGSAAELNLKRGDMANMAVAKYAQAPVLLAGDIERGGIFAQLLGTLWLLEPQERALVRGLLVNKFRGDLALFQDGVHILEDRGSVPVLGVIPYVQHRIPEEDAVVLEQREVHAGGDHEIDIAVIRLPHIANFDDFDPLAAEPGVRVRYVHEAAALGRPHAIILPGSKSTVNDLRWLAEQRLTEAICGHAARGGAVVGICGGYQMLGRTIDDPSHVEAAVEQATGLGLLPIQTRFQGEKATHQVQAVIRSNTGWLRAIRGQTVMGYEIHVGHSESQDRSGWLEIRQRSGEDVSGEDVSGEDVSATDGAIGAGGRIWGCYLHGLFSNRDLRRAWLASLGWHDTQRREPDEEPLQASLDKWADTLEAVLDVGRLDAIIGLA